MGRQEPSLVHASMYGRQNSLIANQRSLTCARKEIPALAPSQSGQVSACQPCAEQQGDLSR